MNREFFRSRFGQRPVEVRDRDHFDVQPAERLQMIFADMASADDADAKAQTIRSHRRHATYFNIGLLEFVDPKRLRDFRRAAS